MAIDGTSFRKARRALVKVALLVAFAGSSVVFCGCDNDAAPPGGYKRSIEFAKLPPSVLSAAQKAISGVTFNEAWENLDKEGKLHSYEIRGKAQSNGKTREVRVSPSGEILEQE